MTLFEKLAAATSEEDVKVAHIKALALRTTVNHRKYNHTIERRVNNDVYLDGVLQQ